MTTEIMSGKGPERVIELDRPEIGLEGFIVLDSTVLGPALGGVRLWSYPSREVALADACRLARAMTCKTAMADLGCGGGKTVLMDTKGLKRREAFLALGRAVEELGGLFYTGRDVGTTTEDIAVMREVSRWVADESPEALGDLNLATARGVFQGIRACHAFLARAGSDEGCRPLTSVGLEGLHVAVQGAGGVGSALAGMLVEAGARVTICDIDEGRAAKVAELPGVEVVSPDAIYDLDADVFAPCALGGVLDEETIQRLRVAVVCGGANNVLAGEEGGQGDESRDALLHRRAIIYAPDYVVNAGAVIAGANFVLRGQRDSGAAIDEIFDRVTGILERAFREDLPPGKVTDRMVDEKLTFLTTWDASC